MDNILTLGITPEEAAQIQTVLDDTITEMKRIRETMRRDDLEIAALQAKTEANRAEIKTMLAELRRS